MIILNLIKKWKLLSSILAILLLLFLGDFYIGLKQDAFIREKEAKKERLEKLAFFMIFPDIHDAWDMKDAPETYEATLKVDNVSDEPVYVTHPEVKAYVQTGTFWTEVAIQDKGDQEREQIYRLDPGRHLYKKILTIERDINYTEYLMYGYMHVRFHISMFVLPESAFKEEEVIQRYTDVYIYLKPFFMSSEEILEKIPFADNKVPIMIPMPPH